MKFLVLTSMLCLLAAISSVTYADSFTYKWSADNGTTQYTQIPPQDRPYTRVKTSSKTSKVETSESPAPKKTIDESASNGEKALAETEAQAAKEKIEIASQRAGNCEKAKQNLIVMQSRPRIRVPLANGEYKILSEEEKQSTIADTKKIILSDCN